MPRSAAKPADVQGKQRILARLKSALGHVRGVAEMVERDAYCIDVMRQTKAVQAALDRVNALLLDRHLRHCVSRAVRSQDAAERERVIGELITVLGTGSRR
jgi:DNA-binding FrmR family transcriptional regulator